ncbi:MAG: ABC transporter permease subunit [Armatimonadetes bacterium]|nr:ABC transporter permease subunit [Armatimonadota bacterium]
MKESRRINSPLGSLGLIVGLRGQGSCPYPRTLGVLAGSGEFIRRLSFSLLLCLLTVSASAAPTLTVGSKRFPESEILGEILTQTANKTGETQAMHRLGLGNTGIVFAALKTGSIDLYPEYVGTISQELLKDKGQPSLDEMNRQLAPMGLAAGVPLGFNDGYGLAMREDEAQKLGIKTLSDLARHPDLKLGLSQEFLKRADGWEGLKAAYGLPFGTPQGFDHGAAYRALAGGQTDVADVYTTDAEIQQYRLRVLDDDGRYFPSYDALLLYRKDLPRRLPKTWAAFQALRGKISAPLMIAMNAEVNISHKSAPAVAADFLAGRVTAGQRATASRTSFWSVLAAPDFWPATWQHLFLVFVSLALSILAGIPLGIWAARSRPAAGPVLSTVGLIQTIPSLALLAFLIPLVNQIGTVPTIIALFLYSLLPIVRNTYTGLTDISPALRESALALGLPAGARLRLIELPLAARAILAGIKTSAVINVGTATIAAFIGAGGYGNRINEGLQTNNNDLLLAGAIPAAALALLVQWAFDLLDRAVVPAGLRAAPPR